MEREKRVIISNETKKYIFFMFLTFGFITVLIGIWHPDTDIALKWYMTSAVSFIASVVVTFTLI